MDSYKYLLGDFGLDILKAIEKGANTEKSIVSLSGVPLVCVKGRTPILEKLSLITCSSEDSYEITEKGMELLKKEL